MADIVMSVLTPSRMGVIPTAWSSTVTGNQKTGVLDADDYYIPNNGRVYVRISDGTAAATMTAEITEKVDQQDVDDRTANIAAGAIEYFGPYPPTIYNNSDGRLHLSFGADDGTLVIEAIQY